MRLMSFSMTTPQVEAEGKDETRRLGWRRAKVGQRVVAVEKAMGLGPGGRPRPLKVIEFTYVRREPLHDIEDDAVAREGYPVDRDVFRAYGPGAAAQWFINKFCRAMGCKPDHEVTVLRFRYVREHELTQAERAQWERLVQRYQGAS